MKKPKDGMDTATDSRTYKRARKYYLSNTGRIRCAFCGYHKAENASRSNKRKRLTRKRK